MIIAREAGKITALLRNPKDSEVVEEDSAAMAALLGLAGDVQSLIQTAGAAQSPSRAVPVLYGGRRMDFKPEDLLLRQDKAHDAGQRGDGRHFPQCAGPHQHRSRHQRGGGDRAMKLAHRLRGQSSVEYAVVCAALAFALGVGMVDSNSVLHQLLLALQAAYQKFSFALSLPI